LREPASEAASKAQGDCLELAGASRAETSEASGNARRRRSETGTLRADATEASSKTQGGGQDTATAPARAESPGRMSPSVAQTSPLAKIRPMSAKRSHRPSASASAGVLMHNMPQATTTLNRPGSAADLRALPRGGGLGAVRAVRTAFE